MTMDRKSETTPHLKACPWHALAELLGSGSSFEMLGQPFGAASKRQRSDLDSLSKNKLALSPTQKSKLCSLSRLYSPAALTGPKQPQP